MNRLITAAAAGGALMAVCQGAGAAGFAIIEQGVSGLGNAFAGIAASAEDATTVFFNPAGMTRLEGNLITAGSHVVIPSATFRDSGSRSVLGLPLSRNTSAVAAAPTHSNGPPAATRGTARAAKARPPAPAGRSTARTRSASWQKGRNTK